MKVFSAEQIRVLDKYTIENEPISSIDLMERASRAFVDRFSEIYDKDWNVYVFCGTGNNGGDGLAISRMLHQMVYDVQVFIIGETQNGSSDFKINLQQINAQHSFKNPKALDEILISRNEKTVVIDALFGSGLNRKVEGFVAEVINKINEFHVISVDIASGLFADKFTEKGAIIKPKRTISFQVPKLAFFQPENAEFVGIWEAVDIDLSKEYISKEKTGYFYTKQGDIFPLERASFSHKGTFGHAYLVAGSYGMMGAAVLATKACLRSGVGKITTHIPKNCVEIMQIAVPEAIVEVSLDEDYLSGNWDLENYEAVAIGPGIGVQNTFGFSSFIEKAQNKKLVIDADGITILGQMPEFLKLLPENTILTPHPKEFKSLINRDWKNDFEKLELLSNFAISNKVIICLKGKNTSVALPNGEIHFNSTGNSGMATAGSGDVLTGIILGFLAQGYSPDQAAIQGVFEHGLAGDIAASSRSERAMIASDIIDFFR